jgi:hypothetical protein
MRIETVDVVAGFEAAVAGTKRPVDQVGREGIEVVAVVEVEEESAVSAAPVETV